MVNPKLVTLSQSARFGGRKSRFDDKRDKFGRGYGSQSQSSGYGGSQSYSQPNGSTSGSYGQQNGYGSQQRGGASSSGANDWSNQMAYMFNSWPGQQPSAGQPPLPTGNPPPPPPM